MTVGARVRWVNQIGNVCEGHVCEVVPPFTFPRSATATKYRSALSYVIRIPCKSRGTRRVWPPNRVLHTLEEV